MAAAGGRHVGHYLYNNSRILRLNNLQLRSFVWSPATRQQTATAKTESTDTIVIPRKKTWSKEAVLQALASTVSLDHTAYPYQFQDDPYLSPRTSAEFKLYSLSQESGKAAAKYFVNTNPKFFTKDFAEPHIPCLMPDTVSLRLDEVSEEALKERISLRKVTAAVDLYDQLLQAGTAVSLETTHDLLDLVCLHGDRDPVQEDGRPETEDTAQEEEGDEAQRRRGGPRPRRGPSEPLPWKENDNNAERIFNLLPERDTACYSAVIRGMVKHGAYVKAFDIYTDMLNNRLTGDVHLFNALIAAAPLVREKYNDRWDLIAELLIQMKQHKVQPNLLTFNSILKSQRRCGSLAKSLSLNTLSEMKALGIAPSLATFVHVLSIFYRGASPAHSQSTDIMQEVMLEVAGKSFTCQDPDDVQFFLNAMRICLDTKDMEHAYRLHSLLEVGENWRLLGDSYQQSLYYGRFFSLLCMMEQIDVVLKWYRQHVPSRYYPSPHGMRDLLQAVDTDGRLDLLPTIWKDIRALGHDNKSELVEELLALMAREKHSPEVQQSFAACALDIRGVYEGERNRLAWSNSSLSHVTVLLLRATRTHPAWEMLQCFKTNNRVPTDAMLGEFLSLCVSEGAPQRAVELVQFSASFGLPETPTLAQRALREFDLTPEQRSTVCELEREVTAQTTG